MTRKNICQHFTLNERPVKTNKVLFINDRIIINGVGTRKKQWHAYHFVITEKLIPFCSLNLNEISCVLSEDERIVYCGEARVQMVFSWILRRLYKNKLSPILLIVSEATYLSYYMLTLSRLPAEIRNSVLVLNEIPLELDKDFVIHNCDNLSYEEKTALAKLQVRFLVILNTTVFAGFDHPRERIKWLGVKSAENPICMAAPSNDPVPLDLYFPDWEMRFKDNHDSATILIPPCADLETMFAHKSESNAFGENAERDLIESLTNLRIGGLLLSGIKSKEFLKTHSVSKQFLKSHSAFEIDVLLLHQKYGIIVFECKAGILNDDIPLCNDNRVITAKNQLHKIEHAMSTVYQAYDSNHPKCFISLVIALPNSTLSAVSKVNFEKHNQLAVWDNEDLQETQLRSKLSSIEKAIHASEIFGDDTVQDGAQSDNDPFKRFAKFTAAGRSKAYISPKLNILALHHGIAHHAYLNPKKGLSSQAFKHIRLAHGDLQLQEQHVYLSREQEDILNDPHNFHIVSGPPGTGKTLLMQLKALSLARNEGFTSRIVLHSGNESSLAEIRQFFELNLTKKHRFPEFRKVLSKQDRLAAIFADEFSAKDLPKIVHRGQGSSGPIFLCITGAYFPGDLKQNEVEKQLKASAEINIKHSFLTTIYRGTEKIINYWKSSYAKIPDIKIGHRIRGNRVEEHFVDYFKQIFGLLITGLEDFCLSESHDTERAVCAVLLDAPGIADAVRAFISSKGFACGSSREHIINPRLITVDYASNCVSLEWPVVFYIETGLTRPYLQSSRLIASSRAMVKLVILNRNFMKMSEKFLEKVEGLPLSLTDMPFSTFDAIILETHRSLYEADMDEFVDKCTYSDQVHVMIRHAFWPSELKSHPGLAADNFYDALAVLNKNPELLFKILSSIEFDVIKLKPIKSYRNHVETRGDVPEYLLMVWKGLPEKEVEKRWTICRELREQITGLINSFSKDVVKKASDKLKELFSDDGYSALKHMAPVIWLLYAVSVWR